MVHVSIFICEEFQVLATVTAGRGRPSGNEASEKKQEGIINS
jgi:hypothetical protein